MDVFWDSRLASIVGQNVCHRYELSVVELLNDSGLVHWHIADIPINTYIFIVKSDIVAVCVN